MPHVFQTFKTKVDPKTGERVYVTDKKGRKIPRPRFRFEYRDYQGVRRTATGATSKTETEKLAQRVQAQHDEIRNGFRPAPKSAEKHATRPITEVTAEYISWASPRAGVGAARGAGTTPGSVRITWPGGGSSWDSNSWPIWKESCLVPKRRSARSRRPVEQAKPSGTTARHWLLSAPGVSSAAT